MANLPGNRFEVLRGDRSGQYSIRINDQWRICFQWSDEASLAINIEIADYHEEIAPMSMAFNPIHPGDVLAEQIEALGITAAEAARALGIPQSRVSQILHGRRAITADTALRLSRWLGTDDEFWMNLQTRYDLDIAKDRKGDAIARIVSPVPTLVSS